MLPNNSLGHQLKTVVISSGGTVSTEVDTEAFPLYAFIFGTMTGVAMTFQSSTTSGGTYVAVNDNTGAAVSITIASNKAVSLTPTLLAQLSPYRYLKLVSGTAEGADRTISVSMKG